MRWMPSGMLQDTCPGHYRSSWGLPTHWSDKFCSACMISLMRVKMTLIQHGWNKWQRSPPSSSITTPVYPAHAHCSPNHTLRSQFIYVYPVLFTAAACIYSQAHPSIELACSMWFEQIDRVAWLTWIYNIQSISCNGGVATKTNRYSRKAITSGI